MGRRTWFLFLLEFPCICPLFLSAPGSFLAFLRSLLSLLSAFSLPSLPTFPLGSRLECRYRVSAASIGRDHARRPALARSASSTRSRADESRPRPGKLALALARKLPHSEKMVRRNVSDAQLFAIFLLVVCGVRGFHGTTWAGVQFTDHVTMFANDVPGMFAFLLSSHDEETLEEDHETWAAHIENRHTGQSGRHPLEALQYTHVRSAFMEVVQAWEPYVSSWFARRAASWNEVALQTMSEAVRGKMPLYTCLNQHGERLFVFAGDYTVQNLAKTLACLVPHLFSLPPIPYSEFLHNWLGSMQSGGSFGDSLATFGLHTAADIISMAQSMRIPRWSCLRDPLLEMLDMRPNWATVLVHQCEVRQALQALGYRSISRILQAPKRSYGRVLSTTFAALCSNPRRASCFATSLLETVAQELNVETGGSPWSSAVNLRRVSLVLASKGLSPKGSVGGIPEWAALVKVCFLASGLTPMPTAYSHPTFGGNSWGYRRGAVSSKPFDLNCYSSRYLSACCLTPSLTVAWAGGFLSKLKKGRRFTYRVRSKIREAFPPLEKLRRLARARGIQPRPYRNGQYVSLSKYRLYRLLSEAQSVSL